MDGLDYGLMNMLTAEEVLHIARLANLPLNDEEISQFQDQLAQTIDYIGPLKEMVTRDVPPTSQITGKVNELREDKAVPGLSQEEALKNSPNTYKGYFVAKIIWE